MKLKKQKKEPKTEKAVHDSDQEANDPETKKKEVRNKSKKPTKKVTKQEENLLPFDPFAPSAVTVANQQQRPTNNPFNPSAVTNPFLGGGPQPNLISTAPLSGNLDYGYNASMQVNMGFNVGPSNFNPNALAVNSTNNNPFNPSGLGVNPSFNPGTAVSQPNPYAAGFISGTNPFTASPSFNNNQPATSAVNYPYGGQVQQNTNPFLNNNPSTPFSNQNPLF